MDLKRFRIGQVVKFTNTVSPTYGDSIHGSQKRTLETSPVSGTGVVVGLKRIMLGTREYLDDEGVYFNATQCVTAWEVRRGYLNKPLWVLDEHISLSDGFLDLPVSYQDHSACDLAHFSETMKAEMKDWPRDSKGRWLKWQRPTKFDPNS